MAPGGQQADLDSRTLVEVRIPASAAQISAVRVVAADLAARQDFDLDAVSDLRMAVDEACATLVPLAAAGATLSCRFLANTAAVEVVVQVTVDDPGAKVPQNTFGWRVLTTLADDVTVLDGEAGTLGIGLSLRRERMDG
ncbi:MAG TPA: ATP-binding protein [Pseudonocardiaceae bacterium]